ncbi:hypothetical protein MSG28_003988 [Choristoneura fumiferana]|uniref:Uncharacterized protein n=1 Tax=Choristoneura fumiferana TaxID=7141 RepID=A0ACC0KI54_CHOFU|nr:hypothetical protein MSG28_003988 [Choristoneura fumiferana]
MCTKDLLIQNQVVSSIISSFTATINELCGNGEFGRQSSGPGHTRQSQHEILLLHKDEGTVQDLLPKGASSHRTCEFATGAKKIPVQKDDLIT